MITPMKRYFSCSGFALMICLLFGLSGVSHASTQNGTGTWVMLMGSGSFKALSPELSRLRWWFDGQTRSFSLDGQSDQTLIRPGLGWAFRDNMIGWIGYAKIFNTATDNSTVTEDRIWQQFIWTGAVKQWSLMSRTRLEQRFQPGNIETGWRFREFVKAVHPIFDTKKIRFAAYNELFINLNSTGWAGRSGFDQNRLFVGLNIPLDKDNRLQAEAGYLNRVSMTSKRVRRIDHLVSVHLLLNF